MNIELLDKIEAEGIAMSWKLPSKNNNGKFAIIGSWQIPKSTGEYLYDLIIENKPKTILELGTSIGYSTLWLALAAKDYGGRVHTIEFFEPKIEVAKKNFLRMDVSEIITLHEGKIIDVLSKWNKNLDFVFFDADKQRYSEYFELIKPWLNKNSIIIVDNAINMKDRMKKFYNYLKENNIEYEVLNFDNGLLNIKFKNGS